MQLEVLKIFCDIAREASFSRGAAENHISQSAASQAVSHLESRLGVKLIDRSKRPLVLTPQGEMYYEGCRDLIERLAELESRVRRGEDEPAGTVRVASIYSVGLHHMSRYVQQFIGQYPRTNVRLEYLHPTKVVESVLNEDADLGLVSYPQRKWRELRTIAWRDEPMVLAVHPEHRLARLPSVEVGQLRGEKLISFDADLSIRREVDRFLRHHDVHLSTVMEFDNIELIKRAVEIPAGVAILPQPTLSQELRSGTLAAVPFKDCNLTRPLAIIHRRAGRLSVTAARFIALLQGADAAAAQNGNGRAAKPRLARHA